MFSVQGTRSLVAVLQSQGCALQLLPESRRLPLSLTAFLPLAVQLRLAQVLLLLQPRGLQQRLVARSDQRLCFQGGLVQLRLQLLLPTPRGLQTAALTLQLRSQSLDGELQLVSLTAEDGWINDASLLLSGQMRQETI